MMSKKSKRIQYLIALDNMLSLQTRDKDGAAKFNKRQLDAAAFSIETMLKLDSISKLESK